MIKSTSSRYGSIFQMNMTEEPSYREKNRRLYSEQKKTLDLFLERGAISKAQYDKSLGDLTRKMGFDPIMDSDLSDDEKIDAVAKKLLEEYREAFTELAK